MNDVLLFVYGTLRKNERNHHWLGNSKLVTEQAWLNGELYDTYNGYPALKEGDERVYGEIYRVSPTILTHVDMLEEYKEDRDDNLYRRYHIDIQTDQGLISCLYYTGQHSSLFQEKIPSGDWKVHNFMKTKPIESLYFAYGSCMDLERFQLAGVAHHFQSPLGKGTLHGYSMKYQFVVHDGGRGDIVEDGGKTEGVVYRLPYDAVEYLYQREGVIPGWYRAALVDIEVDNTLYKDVLTFIVKDKQKETRPPAHYAREILRGSLPYVSPDYHQALKKQLVDLGFTDEQVNSLLKK
ncbi:gamma-glutamylcyclotransferase [Rossellomorea sp. BNER]|uniref:gamma-glutamylcyclotransferase n=1 Tax=Rossellomorea sp. BNER TaxID=2962031 RepID=UPI003AF22265|nr:gamma-glutamylcyclotransferase [Rossellomorea sp. BNER]